MYGVVWDALYHHGTTTAPRMSASAAPGNQATQIALPPYA